MNSAPRTWLPHQYPQQWFSVSNKNVSSQFDVSLVQELEHPGTIHSMNCSPDGQCIATGCRVSAQIFSLNTGIKIAHFIDDDKPFCLSPRTSLNRAVCFSPDGQQLATGGDDYIIRIWDIRRRCISRRLEGHISSIRTLHFSADGRYLISASTDLLVITWDMKEGRSAGSWRFSVDDGPPLNCDSIAFSSDHNFFAAAAFGDIGCELLVWNTETKALIDRRDVVFHGLRRRTPPLAFSPTTNRLAYSESTDCRINLRDINMGETSKEWSYGVRTTIISSGWSPDGNLLMSGDMDGSVEVWNGVDDQSQALLVAHNGPIGKSPVSVTKLIV